jgi:hypothetical protein
MNVGKRAAAAAGFVWAAAAVQAAVTVTNLTVAQRPGTKLVDIRYDVASDATNRVAVSLAVNNGAQAVNAVSLTGDVGGEVATGAGKSIVWDMGADWNGNAAPGVAFSVTADDGVAPPAAGDDLYMVVDLSGGTNAASYPVSYLGGVPAGGWTDEHKTTKLVLRRIPVGTFMMGSPESELGRSTNETQHQVTLTKPYYIGVFELTQKQWERVMGSDPSEYKGDMRPVERVSYDMIRGNNLGSQWPATDTVDGASFMDTLRTKTGMAFDLPTESQWALACRAGTVTALNSGWNLTNENSDAGMAAAGRYQFNQDDGKGGYSQHTKAGSYLPNAWDSTTCTAMCWNGVWIGTGTIPGR